jgi:hypothetical protein
MSRCRRSAATPTKLSATGGDHPNCPNVFDPSVPDTGWDLGRSQPAGLCGALSCPALPQAELTLISDWITQGTWDN